MNRDRPVLRGLLAAGLSWMLLVGAISLGMLVPQQELLRGFGSNAKLDYSSHASAFSPLSLEYIADILGLNGPRTARVGGSGNARGKAEIVAAGGTTTSPETAAAPTDVEHPFTNDDVDNAYKVASLPFRGRTDTSDGSRSADEPADCFPAGGTAWYRYRPTTDVALFSDTFGTPRATALGIYSRDSSGGLELIGCDRNALGNAQVGFRAKAGRVYYFQVTSMVRGGPTIFELASVGRTTVESLSASGGQPDGTAFDKPGISSDGRYLVFTSVARNLSSRKPQCANESPCASVYLRDRVTRRTHLIASVKGAGLRDSTSPLFPSISPDGRYVGFAAFSGVPHGDNAGYPAPSKADRPAWNVYVYDRITEQTRLESRNSKGEPARRDPVRGPNFKGSSGPSFSADGRYVSFTSDGANMGAPVEPAETNVYRRDRVTGITRLVSTDERGRPNRADNCAISGRNISGDGRYVVYRSTYKSEGIWTPDQSITTRGSDGHTTHVYLWDARTGRSRLVSRVPEGTKPKGSYCPSISLDGSRVALVSLDPLVPEDTNQTPDVYAYEVATGRIQRISVTSAGQQTHDPNFEGREYGVLGRSVNLSADGRYAVFDSAAPDLAPGAVGSTRQKAGTSQVFLHDILTGATRLVSVSSTGEPLSGHSRLPFISSDGSAVVFMNTRSALTDSEEITMVVVHELSLFR
ncbi:MAG TPA: hypothetical protein VG929_09395 [Actinomycetota bacterium]|nr:hypothetical protein [Actinomycetota bacterium]